MGFHNAMEGEQAHMNLLTHTQSGRVGGSAASGETQSIDANDDERRATSLTSTRSTPIRPHTRSQTGIVLKRRTPDDADYSAEPKKQATTSRKKPKKPVTDEQADTQTPGSSSPSPQLPLTRHPSLGSFSAVSGDPSKPQSTVWHTSSASDDQPELEHHLPRLRATLPIPIPNLTKKSRGRRVPTQESSRTTTNQKETRLYVCEVEGCGKCFHRGEHLKRHIRSIHTHEKPFKCTHPQCEKYFNRHDNLLQHLKVHQEPHERPIPPSFPISSHRYLGKVQLCVSQRTGPPMDEPESPISPVSPVSTPPRSTYRQIPSPYQSYSAPYGIPPEPARLMTDMAVSSLRTVLPHSPTENYVDSQSRSPCRHRS